MVDFKENLQKALALQEHIIDANNELRKHLKELGIGIQNKDTIGDPPLIERHLKRLGLGQLSIKETMLDIIKNSRMAAISYINYYGRSLSGFRNSKELDIDLWIMAFNCLRAYPINLFRVIKGYTYHSEWKQIRIEMVPEGMIEELYNNYKEEIFESCTDEGLDSFAGYCILFKDYIGDLEKNYIIDKLRRQRKPNYEMIEIALKKYEKDLPEDLLGKLSCKIVEKRMFG